ncbi:PREDICTED: F-box/LRR-repeat protein 12 [Nelumbo nucifera]|uniref:F-box/LRR-repeat protein 12 n=1 Tax=Nelumbo nucifera TaxID=4432 RepID=A0A1U7YU36_NELNU|nr:PREDICTED: F-box/LRR-repeat protein 12 [Nelumbo nucifera]
MGDHCKDSVTSIMDLPDDCLLAIFRWLQGSTDRDSFGLTCRRWLQIQNIGRRSLQFHCSLTRTNLSSFSHVGPNIESFHLYKLLTRFQQLSSLSLSGCTELSDSGLTLLQRYGSNLQSLYLDCCFRITDGGLSAVANGCPSLTSVSLYRCNITDAGLESLAKFCSSLKDMNLSHCSLITDCGIGSLSRECRQLRAVTISFCRGITGIGFRGCSQTLTYLEADSCKFDPNGILGIVSGGGLEYVNVSCLSWCIHGDGLAGIGAGFAMRLRVLNLRMCRSVSDTSIMAIAKGCPALQEWNLALCHEVRLPGWEAIGTNCHNLEVLHVNRCRNLCDRGFQALRDGCKQLSVLYMHRCRLITPTAIELFKCLRGDVKIKEEELMSIGCDLGFRH